jgi:hypothetical protein
MPLTARQATLCICGIGLDLMAHALHHTISRPPAAAAAPSVIGRRFRLTAEIIYRGWWEFRYWQPAPMTSAAWWPLPSNKEMFRQVVETFGFAVEADLDVMRPNQTLAAGLAASLMGTIAGWL